MQIALHFPFRFWDKKIQGADYFGHIPPGPEKRGMFSVFYDLDPQVCFCSCLLDWRVWRRDMWIYLPCGRMVGTG